jgi:hypothetical protein
LSACISCTLWQTWLNHLWWPFMMYAESSGLEYYLKLGERARGKSGWPIPIGYGINGLQDLQLELMARAWEHMRRVMTSFVGTKTRTQRDTPFSWKLARLLSLGYPLVAADSLNEANLLELWSRGWESNPRPDDYESSALPLSHPGTLSWPDNPCTIDQKVDLCQHPLSAIIHHLTFRWIVCGLPGPQKRPWLSPPHLRIDRGATPE